MDATNKVVIEKLQSLTGHRHIALTHRGDGAILLALAMAKYAVPVDHIPQTSNLKPHTTHPKPQTSNPKPQTILIPDQAGWLSFKTLPLLLGFSIVEVKTIGGRIDLDDLKTKLVSASGDAAAFLVQSLGGYFVEQPMEDIITLCREHACLIIEDISGSIGFLSSFDADITVCSFGADKLINLGTGGCLSCRHDLLTQFFDELAPVLRLVQPSFSSSALSEKIDALKGRVAFLRAKAQKIKSDLAHHNLFHPQSVAINVVVGFGDEHEKDTIVAYCRNNALPFKLCPRYNRVLAPAVSIELKKLDV